MPVASLAFNRMLACWDGDPSISVRTGCVQVCLLWCRRSLWRRVCLYGRPFPPPLDLDTCLCSCLFALVSKVAWATCMGYVYTDCPFPHVGPRVSMVCTCCVQVCLSSGGFGPYKMRFHLLATISCSNLTTCLAAGRNVGVSRLSE